MLLEIFEGEMAAQVLSYLNDGFCDVALIEPGFALFG